MKSWYVFTLFLPLLLCFIMFFCVFFFAFFFFVLFCFVFFSVLFEIYSAWVFFFLLFCLSCFVFVLFCFVLFCLISLGFWFFVCFFFYRHRCLFTSTPCTPTSICYGTCETDRECEWLNEWKLLLKGTVWVWVYLQPTMNFTKVKISLWPIVAFPLISELNESDWRACRSDNQGRETNLNCKCYVPIHYSYLLPVLHVEGFWKLQARNRGVLFSFTGVKKHFIFGVILFEVVSFEDDRRRLFLRDWWMDLFGFNVEEWWMSLCHEFSSR